MFEGISFNSIKTRHPLTSGMLSEQVYKDHAEYDKENLSNSRFSIYGGADIFVVPPISSFAQNNFFFLQAFNIFHYKEESFTERKYYPSIMVLYTYGGSGILKAEGKEYHLEKGDGAVVNCILPHYYQAMPDWDVGVLHFYGPMSEYFYQQYAEYGTLLFHESMEDRFQQFLEQVLHVYSKPSLHRDLLADNNIEALMIHLIHQVSSQHDLKETLPDAIQKAVRYMEDHYQEDISLDKLSMITNISKYHFSKEFKRYTGLPPHEYLISLRIRRAKALLKTSDIPASKIARMVGINDVNNFNYHFKKRVGMTPTQYRKSSDPFF